MDTSFPAASSVEALVEPVTALQEAQASISLLKQKTVHSDMPIPVNLHQNINGNPMPTNFNDNEESLASSLHAVFLTESKDKPLPLLSTKGLANHQVCSHTNLDVSKFQANVYAPSTLSPQISSDNNSEPATKPESFIYKESTTDTGSCPKNSAASPETCKTEVDVSVKKKTLEGKEGSIPFKTKVNSLVFFDLETTGLAFEIGKSNVQITEVSMIAINRKEFEESTLEDLRDIRIIQKLCLCTRPRSKVSSSAAAVTGLNNENLVDQTPFERNSAEAINFFLSHLPKPVCLIAHNGNLYDFPILKAEFSRLSMSLPSDLLIADTLKAIRVLGVPTLPPGKKISKLVKYSKSGKVSCSLPNLYLYFFNKNPIGSHSSEGDCIAMAQVCHQMKDVMLLWIDENCKTFDSVAPMW